MGNPVNKDKLAQDLLLSQLETTEVKHVNALLSEFFQTIGMSTSKQTKFTLISSLLSALKEGVPSDRIIKSCGISLMNMNGGYLHMWLANGMKLEVMVAESPKTPVTVTVILNENGMLLPVKC